MNKLLKTYFIEQFKINRIYHNPNKKEQIKSILMGIVFVLFFGLIGCYSYLTFYGLSLMNCSFLIPGISLTSIFGLVFILNFFFLMPGFCFNNKEDEMILALPLKMREIVSARIGFIYIISLILSGLNLVPALIVMISSVGFNIQTLIFFLLSLLFPLLPIALAGLCNAVITKISGRFRYKNLVKICLTFGFLFCYFGLMMNFNQIDEQALLLYIENMATDLGVKFFLASWLSEAMALNLAGLLKFILVEVLSLLCYIWLMSHYYHQFSSDRHDVTKSKKKVEFQTESVIKALFKKDIKRYFSSSLYVVNTMIGSIFYLVFSLGALTMEPSALGELIGFPFDREMLVLLLPFIGMLLMALSVTTSASLSIEGKNIWILKSLPIKPHQIYLSKLLVQLVQTLPVCIVCSIILMIGLNLSLSSFFWVLIIPSFATCFMGMLGLKMNQLFPNYDWKSEAEVIKRGMSMTVTLFAGSILSVGTIVLLLFNRILPPVYFNAMVAVILLAMTGILIPWTMKHPL